MEMFHKAGAALLAIVGLTVAADAMGACDVQLQRSWKFGGPQYRTLNCQNTNLANFQLNTSPNNPNNAVINLTGGTYAQVLGLTQSGAYVSGCSADDLTANNVPVYLNWNGNVAACQQAYFALLAAGKAP